ncbi:hypothetical protein C0J52_21419 [Blattella germanica]|nr:hypothetical protein C0J52_21419 [Blattella germanica]
MPLAKDSTSGSDPVEDTCPNHISTTSTTCQLDNSESKASHPVEVLYVEKEAFIESSGAYYKNRLHKTYEKYDLNLLQSGTKCSMFCDPTLNSPND